MKPSVLSALLIGLLTLAPARADGPASPTPSLAASPTPTDKKLTKEEKKEKKAKDKADENDFQFPVAENQDILGIKIPHYGPDGKLSMLLDAKVARKLDPSHIQMDTLHIDSYGDDGRKISVEMPSSTFNLDDRVLRGDKGVTVIRDDFVITGDTGEFYTKTRFAKVMGNIKMTISSTDTPQ